MDVREMTQSEARALLDEYRAMAATRADRARIAVLSGLSKTEIADRMGVARSTIYLDLADQPERK
jgi:transposase